VEVLEAVNKGVVDSSHGLLKVSRRYNQKSWVVDIRSIVGMAHLLPYGPKSWLVNTKINLKTWNEFY
jgi:hypothetical protein